MAFAGFAKLLSQSIFTMARIMKFAFQSPIFQFALILICMPMLLRAETEAPHLNFALSDKTVQLIPLSETASLNCAAPAVPTKIELSYDIALNGQNLAVFEPATPKLKGIVVRRGGQISQNADDNLPGRFVSKPTEPAHETDNGDLTFRARLYFCENLGFLTFMRGEYAVATEIGQYALRHEGTQLPTNSGELSLGYQGQKWARVQDGELVPLQAGRNVGENEIGLLTVDLRLTLATFAHKDQGSSIEAQLTVKAHLAVVGTKVKK